MRFTFISKQGDGLGLATHLSSEGHAVSLALENGSEIGEGIVQCIKEDTSAVAPDIYVVDDESYGDRADLLRNNGNRVLGSSQWSQLLESSPDYMKKVIQLVGWDTDTVSNGVNLYITAWFNGTHYISSYCSLVYKRFMTGGRGPDVRFTGVLSTFNPLTDQTFQTFLKPLQRVLRRVNHRGCFHIHAVTTGDLYSVKEVSASFSSPLSLLLYENAKASATDILLRLFDESSRRVPTLESYAAGLLLTVPPFPYKVASEPTVLKGLETPALKHLWVVDAKKRGTEWSTTGAHGKIGYVTARGSSVHEAVKRAYRTVGKFEIRDLQFRDDVGKDVQALLEHLTSYRWIT